MSIKSFASLVLNIESPPLKKCTIAGSYLRPSLAATLRGASAPSKSSASIPNCSANCPRQHMYPLVFNILVLPLWSLYCPSPPHLHLLTSRIYFNLHLLPYTVIKNNPTELLCYFSLVNFLSIDRDRISCLS